MFNLSAMLRAMDSHLEDNVTLPDGRKVTVCTDSIAWEHRPYSHETMVFPEHGSHGLYVEEWFDVDEASAGHERIVEQLRAGTLRLDWEGVEQ